MSEHIIRGVSFEIDTGGTVIEYVTPGEDVRENGLVRNHALLIPPSDEFDDVVIALEKAAQAALDACLTAYHQAPAVPLPPPEPDDEDPSPYDNPRERDLP